MRMRKPIWTLNNQIYTDFFFFFYFGCFRLLEKNNVTILKKEKKILLKYKQLSTNESAHC